MSLESCSVRAPTWVERLHEPLRVVDLELEVHHGALAHGPLELGRVHVGVRRPLELPPLAVLELHEARHEGAAGEAVGPVQPPDPGAQHVSTPSSTRMLRLSAVRGPYRPFPTFMRVGGAQSKWSCSSGGKS